ncbi:protein-O-mannosyltransferase-like protein [Marinimicrobium koreense]|uniref:Polyprenol-phosphate-mannose--protein mannosyltransferase n=1 Tax=Marinimicrobium koreense TaxID=306545 RepID=A0A3N1NX42_9GAMM|nr:protein-O-mannosyltransferase-like protein [Marinimicrobium koreense]
MLQSIARTRRFWVPALVLLVSLLVYGVNYGSPKAMFWDENYHVTSGQKYLDGTLFMELHPPLGKLLIAAGEKLFGGNEDLDKSRFNRTDYLQGSAVPEGMSYTGFRFASTFLMALSVLFFYGIVWRITRRVWVAAGFSALLIFDNALVVHSRAAMLEGIQLFFILAALYYFVHVLTRTRPIRLPQYAILGVLVGLVVSVKLNGAVLLLLFVMLWGVDQWENLKAFRWKALLQRLATTVPSAVLPLLAVFASILYVHIALGENIVGNSTYKASEPYLEEVRAGRSHSLSAFYYGFQDNLRYMLEYSDGVARLDICKPGENGSYAIGWPLGNKSINYRWDKNTVDGEVQVRYIQIIANPIVWFSVALGVILSLGLAISRFVYGNPVKDERQFYWVMAFTTLYASYMIAILQIERVMYLYHYLVPLVFGMLNLAMLFTYIFRDEVLANRRHTMVNLGLFVVLVVAMFAYFSPFTYGLPINEDQFEARNWFHLWQMNVVR